MKKIGKLLMLPFLLLWAGKLMAQDIQVKRFDRDYTGLVARMNPAYDNAGEACAVIKFFFRGKDYDIEPNLGVVKKEVKSGELLLWVPKGTKRVTIRHKGLKPLVGYEIPVQIESKTDYIADIETMIVPPPDEKHVYVGLGFNVLSIMGPSVAVGFKFDQHNIELGAVYGLNKSDEWYFYDNSGNATAAYSYQAIRLQLRYGYELELGDYISVTPQVGAAYNLINGKAVSGVVANNSSYKNANSMSAFGAVRFEAKLNDSFRLQITPEYDFGVYKNNTCKLMSDKDSKLKSWTDGINLNVGLMVFF